MLNISCDNVKGGFTTNVQISKPKDRKKGFIRKRTAIYLTSNWNYKFQQFNGKIQKKSSKDWIVEYVSAYIMITTYPLK